MTVSRSPADILDRIETREVVVAVIGLGYVGLPLAVVFAEAGFRVVGIDVDQGKVKAINQGESYVQDVPPETLSRLTLPTPKSSEEESPSMDGRPSPRLSATTDYDALHDADMAIVCVPTPLSKTKDPDFSYIIAAADEIARRLHSGMLVVLESTTFPGTTEEMILPRLQHANGQKFNVEPVSE